MCPGPASKTYYDVPPALRNLPDLNVPGKFRAELSAAYSLVYHLKPHAIILSYLEDKPLPSYIDYEGYAKSAAFYDLPKSPAIDMLYTRADVVACRRLFTKGQLPQPKKDNDW